MGNDPLGFAAVRCNTECIAGRHSEVMQDTAYYTASRRSTDVAEKVCDCMEMQLPNL